MAAARELFAAGLRTPKAVREAERQTMIDAFGRASYARYDESSATRLTDIADALSRDSTTTTFVGWPCRGRRRRGGHPDF